MQYNWIPYSNDHASLVDSWLDACAMKETGLEDGWRKFYDYWMTENPSDEGKDCCFLISDDKIPFAVIYIAIMDTNITISEYVVAPNKRGMGYGAAALKEFLDHSVQLLNFNASAAKAVVFSSNIASQKAFEKAGFALASKDLDGAIYYYEYKFCGHA